MGANKHELKKGDRVTRGDWHAIGTIISTHEKHGQGYAEIDYGEWGNWKFRLTELKLIHRPAEPAPLFAVGDKVRTIKNPGAAGFGATAKVGSQGIYYCDVCETDLVDVVWDGRHGQNDGGYYLDYFEPAPTAETVAASNDTSTKEGKFKVGDRVNWTRVRGEFDGSTIEAIDVKDFAYVWPYKLRATNGSSTFAAVHELEPAPLTIQAGGFYKTRDGRKVGPAVVSDGRSIDRDGNTEAFYVGGMGLYSRAGTWLTGHNISDNDLIAEWPASNTKILNELEDWMAENPLEAADRKAKLKKGSRVVLYGTVNDASGDTLYVDIDGLGTRYNRAYPRHVVELAA